jgi:hypothetical protein
VGQLTAEKEARIQALVLRDSRDETTFAIVTAPRIQDLQSARHLVSRFTEAVTAWVRDTEEGKEAYKESDRDYNVGDLANDVDEPTLAPYLAAQGLFNVEIEIRSDEDFQDTWSYDTRLVAVERLAP